MKKIYPFLCALLVCNFLRSQIYFRPAEALKQEDKTEALVIFPDKDDLLKLQLRAPFFKALHTVKISGICDSTKIPSVFRTIALFPSVKTLQIEQSSIEKIPEEVSLPLTIEKLEAYENEMLNYTSLFKQLKGKMVRSISLDLFDLNELPAGLSDLPMLTELNVYDKGSVMFDPHKKYESHDADVKKNSYALGNGQRNIIFNYHSAEFTPGEAEMALLKKISGMPVVLRIPELAEQFEKKYQSVTPPIEGLNASKEVFTQDAKQNISVQSKSGATINIPANAFTDEKGQIVKGDVSIGFREYRNAADILVSGIPMTFDSGGVKNQFESAGMFEITANVNGKEVFLAKNKKIEVSFPVENSDGDFNFYRLDDKKGNWENSNTAVSEHQSEKKLKNENKSRKKIYSPAIANYKELAEKKSGLMPDTTRFEQRFEDMNYAYLYHKKSITKKVEVHTGEYVKLNHLIAVKPDGFTQDGQPLFKIENYSASHPELSYFWFLRWIPEGGMAAFKKQFDGKKFSDARIEGDGTNFEIVFKNEKGFQRIKAQLVQLSRHRAIVEKNAQVKAAWTKYTKRMSIKKKIFNRRIRNLNWNENQYEVFTPQEIELAAWMKSKRLMNAELKKKSLAGWKNYCDSVSANNLLATFSNNYGTELKTTRFVSTRLGIHNFDRVVKMKDRVEVFVKLKEHEQKKGIRLRAVYAIEEKSNVVYTYPATAEDSTKIVLDKDENYKLIGITPDGKITWSEQNTVKGSDLRNNKEIVLPAETLQKNPENIEEMKKLLGI